jgi:hypothetical protein
MKKCPACNRPYDDTLRFCLDDGATLVRTDESATPTMTVPFQSSFQPPPPPPTVQMPHPPSLSTWRSLTNIFFAPARVFDSFRDVTTPGQAISRFLPAAAIIVVAMLSYNVIYLARIGPENIARASIATTPLMTNVSVATQERAIQQQRQSGFQAITLAVRFGVLIVMYLASFTLGGLIYWGGGLLFKGSIKYLQALLVWTYAALPPVVIWVLVNTLVLLISPPTTNMAIATGANGLIHANLGAFFDVTMLPIPVYVVALSTIDLFEFFGLALAMTGLRKTARIHWIGSFVVVIFVWLMGVIWRFGSAGVIGALMKR